MVGRPGSVAGQPLGGQFPKLAGLDLGVARQRHFVLAKNSTCRGTL
jgi:hypothetical protein